MNVLLVSPHPDDELLIAPVTLSFLKNQGNNVQNLVVSLGRKKDQQRRKKELLKAADDIGFPVIIPDNPVVRDGDNSRIIDFLKKYVKDTDLIVSPSPFDPHPLHESVGRAVRDFIAKDRNDIVWWQGSVWSDLDYPSIITPFDSKNLNPVLKAFNAYKGEVRRNDYRQMLFSRTKLNATMGPERVFGFGEEGLKEPFAELLSEVIFKNNRFFLTPPRIFSASEPLARETSVTLPEERYLRGGRTDKVFPADITDFLNQPPNKGLKQNPHSFNNPFK